MKKIYSIITSAVLTLAISTNIFFASAIDEYGNPISYFFIDNIGYSHDDNSTDVKMLGNCFSQTFKTLYIPEYVENDNTIYTVKEITFGGIDGYPECVNSIKTINISKNLKTFTSDNYTRQYKDYAWQNLKTINIPKDAQLESIGYFDNCPKLKSVYIPASVTKLDFTNCPNLKMTISNKNKKYKMKNARYLCSKNGKRAYSYFGKQKSNTIPKGVTTLFGTFRNNKYIKNVTIPSSVKTIKNYTFSNCKGLSKVIIKSKKKVPKIEKDQFTKPFEGTKKGIKFYVKNKKVAKSLKKQLKGSGVRKAKILIGKKVVYKNVK